MKYLVLAKSSDDPATRYRVDPLVRTLTERGDEVRVLNEPGLLDQLKMLLTVSSFDLVFIQRKLFNSLLTRLMGWLARSIVFDHDDAIFLKSSGKPSRTRGSRYRAVLESADLVLGGNNYLCDNAREFSDRVELVPTSLDVSRYGSQLDKEESVTLVWIGSRSTSRYLEHHRSILERIGQEFPGIQLKIISDFELNLQHLRVVHVPWSDTSESAELASSWIGIAPMVDDAWTRGKCALKVIQYMAAGLPVVSSAVGANRDVVEDGVTGFLVDDGTDWLAAVGQLIESAALRQELGSAGRRAAEKIYSIDATVDRIVSLLDEVTGR